MRIGITHRKGIGALPWYLSPLMATDIAEMTWLDGWEDHCRWQTSQLFFWVISAVLV